MSDNSDTDNILEYDNLDFRINSLYDAVYNKHGSQNYNFKSIVLNNITLLDIKMPDTFDKTNVFNTQIKKIDEPLIRHIWFFKRIGDNSHNCLIEIGKYRYENPHNYNDLGYGELYDPSIHYILSELVIVESLKHVLLPIMFFDTTLVELKQYENTKEIVDTLEPQHNDGDKYYVFIKENYFKSQLLEAYLFQEISNMTILHWKVLFFQVLYTLYKISERLSKFRHNKLDLQSIRIYKRKEKDNKIQYKVGNNTFWIPDIGFEIKITNFYYATTSSYIKNKSTSLFNENPYYDVHYFISSIYLYLKRINREIPDYLMQFINDIIPSEFMPDSKVVNFLGLNETKFNKQSSEIIPPALILTKNNFFQEFITNNMDIPVSPVLNEKIKIRDLGARLSNVNYTYDSNITDTTDITNTNIKLSKRIKNKKKQKNINSNSNTRRMLKGNKKITVSRFNNELNNDLDNEDSIHEHRDLVTRSKNHTKKNKKYNNDYEDNNDYDDNDDESDDNRDSNDYEDSEDIFDDNDVKYSKRRMETKYNTKQLSDTSLDSYGDSNDDSDGDSGDNESNNSESDNDSGSDSENELSETSFNSSDLRRSIESVIKPNKSRTKNKKSKNKSKYNKYDRFDNNELDDIPTNTHRTILQDRLQQHQALLGNNNMMNPQMKHMMGQQMMDPMMMNQQMNPQMNPQMMDPMMSQQMNPMMQQMNPMMDPQMMGQQMMDPMMQQMNPQMNPQIMGQQQMMDPMMQQMNPQMMDPLNQMNMGANTAPQYMNMQMNQQMNQQMNPMMGGKRDKKNTKKYGFIKNNKKLSNNELKKTDFFFQKK